jgi:hypothetical protein
MRRKLKHGVLELTGAPRAWAVTDPYRPDWIVGVAASERTATRVARAMDRGDRIRSADFVETNFTLAGMLRIVLDDPALTAEMAAAIS